MSRWLTDFNRLLVASVMGVFLTAQPGFGATAQNSPGHGSVVAQVSPAIVTLTSSASQQFDAMIIGQSDQTVTWSLTPALGSISGSGLFTAPVGISARQTVTVTATSVADPTKSASASVMLTPVVTVTLSPSGGTVAQSGTLQFTPVVSGASDTSVSWSLSPAVGNISSTGLYSAAAIFNTNQTVTVTATSLADPTKSASAAIRLSPVVSVVLNPPSATVTSGATVQIYPTVSGTPDSSLNWSLNPPLGSISSGGLYTAPDVIASQQVVTVFAASKADTSKSATVSITLRPGVTVTLNVGSSVPVTLSSHQVLQLAATVTGTSIQNVSWSLAPQIGTISNSGLYTAPSSVSASQLVRITATSLSDPTASATAMVVLQAGGSAPPGPLSIALPVEVIGLDGYTVTVPVSLPSVPLGIQQLSMRIHGLRFESQASVQVNGSGFLPINTASANVLGLGKSYGGIGGGFSTLDMTLNLPPGTVSSGLNTVQFRFNGTDGRVSGFRVLEFNVVVNGSSLLSPSTFTYEDPSQWQPPSTRGNDIAVGQLLWRAANLTVPVAGGTAPILAHCMDCHAQDGRDLKYFNYSNNSIRTRSMFHGLTANQGDQIASYIRSLNITVPPNARPWNPPYQPGPGLDSQPVANWAAGAGLDAVLPDDASMLPYLAPNGSTTGWAANQYLNARELPISLQLPDWNSWLPAVHPMDAYGASFTNSTFKTTYDQIRATLVPGDYATYARYWFLFPTWHSAAFSTFLGPLEAPPVWTEQSRTSVFSAALWMMVKSWEINQEFGLEGMPSAAFGPKANSRGWFSVAPFQVSPLQLHVPFGPGLGNGSYVAADYLGYVWYHTQLLLNDGNGYGTGQNPIDWGYTEGRVLGLANDTGQPHAMLEFVWLIKSLQEMTQLGVGPDQGPAGFEPTEMTSVILVHPNWEIDWSAISQADRVTLTQAFLQAYFNQLQTYSVAQYNAGTGSLGAPWASPTEDPHADDGLTVFGGEIWFMLPRMRYVGVSPSLTYSISAWARTLWPAGDWVLNDGAICTTVYFCTSD